jgi:hypothetical protein
MHEQRCGTRSHGMPCCHPPSDPKQDTYITKAGRETLSAGRAAGFRNPRFYTKLHILAADIITPTRAQHVKRYTAGKNAPAHLHSKVDPSSLESNLSSTSGEVWMATGLEVMLASGAVESMEKAETASVSAAEAAAAARAWNLHGTVSVSPVAAVFAVARPA